MSKPTTHDSSPTIRPAGSADARLLSELGTRTFSETFAGDNTAEDMASYLASSFIPSQLAAELADSNSIFLIAEIDRVAVGYAKLYVGDPVAGINPENPIELVRLYVCQEWLGRGVGNALMLACLNEARQKGFQTLWLGVWEHNARARAFYRKWDFREVGDHIFQLGSDQQRDIVLERSVG
jgi:diamine N-acetyltransferase